MTNEEYSEIMDNSNFMIDSSNTYDMKIKEAFEKQILQVPYAIDFSDGEYQCPRCDELICHINNHYEMPNFCPNCGQRLDWSEVEEESECPN